MDQEPKASSPKQKAGSVAWKLIALIAIGVASWTVKTTFGPEKIRYFSFTGGSGTHFVYRYNDETGEMKRLFPRY